FYKVPSNGNNQTGTGAQDLTARCSQSHPSNLKSGLLSLQPRQTGEGWAPRYMKHPTRFAASSGYASDSRLHRVSENPPALLKCIDSCEMLFDLNAGSFATERSDI